MPNFSPPPTYADPVLVDEQTGRAQFNPLWLRWFLDVTSFITTNGGGGLIQHNTLGGLQGGLASEYFHLTTSQHTDLTAGFTGTGVLVRQTNPDITNPTITQGRGTLFDYLGYSTTPTGVPVTTGTLAWDGGTTLGLQMTANVLGRVNESGYIYAKASSAITKGQVVMHTGSVGASGVVTAAPATGITDGLAILGVAAESIALNGFGLIQYSGTLKGLDTSAYADGDTLYYDPAVVGGLTKTKPSAPNVKALIGEVINAGNGGSGSINVRIFAGSELGGTDSNVQFGTLADKDLIQYDSALKYWKNIAASSIAIGTATNLAGGATGSLPYQSAASTTTFLSLGTAAQVLQVNAGATAPEWVSSTGTGNVVRATSPTLVTPQLGTPTSGTLTNCTDLPIVGGTTGTLTAARGGTGQTTYTIGDLLYADTATSLAKLADVATGNALISGGVGVAPSWGKIGLTTHVSGTLPLANGGTNVTATPTNGQLLIGNGTGYTLAALTGTANQVVVTNGAGSITLSLPQSIDSTARPTFAGVTLTGANSTTIGQGQIYLNGTGGNRIDFNATGFAAPAFTTRSVGTKAVWYPSLDATSVDYATGIAPTILWNSVPQATSTFSFKWYGGQTLAATLTGDGDLSVTGDVFAGSLGTAGAPAYSWTSDPDTGMWSPGANTLAFSTNATERMRINSSGNIYAGTTSSLALEKISVLGTTGNVYGGPYPVLMVLSDDRAYDSTAPSAGGGIGFGFRYNVAGTLALGSSIQGIKENTTNDDYSSALRILTRTNGAHPAERVRITSAGNFGIGTTTPDALLTVNTIASFGDGAVGTPSIAHKGDLNTGFWFPAADTIAASTAGSERVRIDSSGNVGIGTSTPPQLLTVYKVSATAYTSSSSATTAPWGLDGGPVCLVQNAAATDNSASYLSLISRTAGGQTTIGYVGNVSGTGTGTTITGAALVFGTRTTGASNYAEAMRITSAGNVGIGTTTNLSTLTVNGSFASKSPSTVNAATYTVATTDSSLRFTTTNCTVTLPTASSFPGRILYLNTITANSVTSASSNVIPLGSNTAGTAIFAATAGKFAMIQSDGTNWITMMAN